MPLQPMLGEVELQLVQKIDTDEDQVLVQHGVPALEGDFLQGLGRRAERVTLTGVLTGPESGDGLKTLREKFRAAEPVSFVADIASATQVDKVLIEEMGVRELAGKPERFEYALTLREFLPPPLAETEQPPPPPPPEPVPPLPSVETGTLVVEVIVESQPEFDFSTVTVTLDGTQDDGTAQSRNLVNRTGGTWTETEMPPGQYAIRVVVTEPQSMSGEAQAMVRGGQTTRVQITLRPGAIVAKTFIVHFRFDNAFVEPCMLAVLRQVAQYASDHPTEKLLIVGNTDEAGSPGDLTASDPYNQSLSERRARSTFAVLTSGLDANASVAEWNVLRQKQTGLTTIGDKWDVRQYQHMLQDLDFYPGNVDGIHGATTNDAVRTFREAKSLPPGTTVDDAVWNALIADYLSQDELAVPASQFLPNTSDGCNGGILKWLGVASQDPVKNVRAAWRPNRRVELLFVPVAKLPCQEPQPDTFNLPFPGAVNPSWCLGPGDKSNRACFVVKHLPPGQEPQNDEWIRMPAEPGTVAVRGSIKFEDGTPAADVRYVLIASDGEFMDGEQPSGEGVVGRTKADGTFEYPEKPKGIGIYTLEVQGPFVVRLADDPPGAGKGNIICKRLDGTSSFDAILSPAETGDPQRKLRGAIFDRTSEARKQTGVDVVFSDGTRATTITNDEGEFVVEMALPQEVGKIRYNITDEVPPDILFFKDFFIDVQGINTDEGVRRRLHNLGYLINDDVPGALLLFQAAQGLDTTGEADEATRARLAAVHDETSPLLPAFDISDQTLSPDQLNGAGPPI
jgi:outer membrane protein OmpA-like peptidoglycan-associated protein